MLHKRQMRKSDKAGRRFFAWYLMRDSDGRWSDTQKRLRVNVNPGVFGDDASKRTHIENTIACTFDVLPADVCCLRFRSQDGVYEWSADADDVVARTQPVAPVNLTPKPSGEWIAEMSADDIRDAAERHGLPVSDFDDSHNLAELRQNLAFALHGNTATDSE
jgi:hypothetical protein